MQVTEVPSYIPPKGSKRPQKPRKTLSRGTGLSKPKKAVARRTKGSSKKPKVSEVLREYGLPDYLVRMGKKGLRYRQPLERGILWYWFSRWVREVRDKDFPCISCGGEHKAYQGGHFIPAGSASCDDMVFEEMNVHKEGDWCNQRDKRKLGYGINLDLRYGEGTKASLERRYVQYKLGQLGNNWGKLEYIEKIKHYKALVEKLENPTPPVLDSEQ